MLVFVFLRGARMIIITFFEGFISFKDLIVAFSRLFSYK